MIVSTHTLELEQGVSELLLDVHNALEHNDTEFAGACLVEHLYDKPNDTDGLILLARFLIDGGKAPFAYPVAKQAVAQQRTWRTLMMLGATEAVLQTPKQAIKTLNEALRAIPKSEPDIHKAMLYRLLANAYVQDFNFEKAENWAKKSLAIESHSQAHTAYAFSKLHKREWREGWYHYKYQLGHADFRKKHDYGLPEWNGEQDANLMVYGEQGLGDQIAFMSACPVPPKQINCHPKLEGLFKATFPRAEVYGKQFDPEFTEVVTSTHQTSMATMMQWADMKPRGAYLKTIPEKEIMWKGLLDSLGEAPKIGIAWTGGVTGSDGWRTRKLNLKDLQPLLELPMNWVSLQYKDFSDEVAAFKKNTGITIHEFPWGTMSQNYEDTAAMVNCLDAVVCVPTTVYHLAGALGKPAFVLVHEQPHWHEGLEGDCPWWETVEFYRRPQLTTKGAINAVTNRIKGKFSENLHWYRSKTASSV